MSDRKTISRVLVFELSDGDTTMTKKFYGMPDQPKDYQVWEFTQQLQENGYTSVKLIDSWITRER